jgi:fucose permease
LNILQETGISPEVEPNPDNIMDLMQYTKPRSITPDLYLSKKLILEYIYISFPYYFYQFVAISLELFIINTIILYDTKQVGTDVSNANNYNICYTIFIIGEFTSMLLTKIFIVRRLYILPTIQFTILLFLVYLNLQSKS